MTDKEKYINLMQRYWEAETSPDEEQALARYVARVDDPEFDELRGVLGYLSIGRQEKTRRSRSIRSYAFALAASVAIVAALGVSLSIRHPRIPAESCVRYAYGQKENDNTLIMNSVEDSLAEFFGQDTPAETGLIEMFRR